FKILSREIREQGVMFIVNDDLRLALELEADGVHFGQEDIKNLDISQIPDHLLVGISTHNPDQVAQAKALGADYIGVGPIFETRTKKNVEKSDGLQFLKWVSNNVEIPYVAIGGIEPVKLAQLRENGLKIAAMISSISKSESDKELRDLVEQFCRTR
ncbi:MAG: thiamine phosphate synthase, partial [Desulfamplus sp.]|nr:thiamine phosphate synthase [Desulfamplus sp.]